MVNHSLSRECADVRPALSEAVASHWGYTEQLTLSQSCCGFATALLQQHLRRRGIATDRLIATPPQLPRGYNYRRRQHVMLRTEDGDYLDPTYQQFANLVGYSHLLHEHVPDVANLLPAPVIAITPENQHEKLSEYVAGSLLANRALILIARKTYMGPVSDVTAPLAAATKDEIHEVCHDIWDPSNYEPFPIDEEDLASQTFERADAIMKQKTPKLRRLGGKR